MQEPDDETVRLVDERFIGEYWPRFAAFAWRCYLEHGRGALVQSWASVNARANGRPFPVGEAYLTYSGIPEIQRHIENYDPRTTVIVLVLDDADVARIKPQKAGSEVSVLGGVLYRVVTRAPAPPDAYGARTN